MNEPVSEFTIKLNQIEGYKFAVDFNKGSLAPLIADESPPLGHDDGPSPSRLLASAIGGCLSMSLLFCLSKSRIAVNQIGTEVKLQTVRNEARRLRVGRAEVTIQVEVAPEDRRRAQRCLGLFEDFCTVTAAVREGIEVAVQVEGLDDGTARQGVTRPENHTSGSSI